jgi:mono/diheme cytochrome c family protein
MRKIVLVLIIGFVVSCGKKKEQDFYGVKDSSFKKSYVRGEAIYNDMCITCHMANGEGVPKAFPPLAGSDYLENNQELSIKAVKYGMSGEIVVNGTTYNSVMASMGLNDQEVADVMNYINRSWGNNYGEEITEEKVTKITP